MGLPWKGEGDWKLDEQRPDKLALSLLSYSLNKTSYLNDLEFVIRMLYRDSYCLLIDVYMSMSYVLIFSRFYPLLFTLHFCQKLCLSAFFFKELNEWIKWMNESALWCCDRPVQAVICATVQCTAVAVTTALLGPWCLLDAALSSVLEADAAAGVALCHVVDGTSGRGQTCQSLSLLVEASNNSL